MKHRGILIRRATPKFWMLELTRIGAGERDLHILPLGSAAAYIDQVLFRCLDSSAAETHLHSALEQFYGFWQWDEQRSPATVWHVLDIASRYLPVSGFPKIASVFQHVQILQSTINFAPAVDLRRQALDALASYWPTPPLKPNDSNGEDAFRVYLRILAEHLRINSYKRYAAYTLAKLECLEKLRGSEWYQCVADREILTGMLEWLLESESSPVRENWLREIFVECLEIDRKRSGTAAQELFLRIAHELGFSAQPNNWSIRLVPPIGRHGVEFAVPPSYRQEFYFWNVKINECMAEIVAGALQQ